MYHGTLLTKCFSKLKYAAIREVMKFSIRYVTQYLMQCSKVIDQQNALVKLTIGHK